MERSGHSDPSSGPARDPTRGAHRTRTIDTAPWAIAINTVL